MKKRFIAGMILAAMAVTTLVGCGSSSTPSPQTTAAAGAAGGDAAAPAADNGGGEAAAPATGGGKVLFVTANRDEFGSSLESAMMGVASERGYELVTQDANNDSSKQIQFIEAGANADYDAVFVRLVDSETGQECINKAGNMKVVFTNISPTDLSILNENACMVASDNYEAGTRQGEFIAQYFKDKGKTDIKYILLQGTLGMIHTEQRTQGAIDAMKANGLNATEASAPLVSEYDRATAMDNISPLIGTTEFDCIISNNDAMALGAIEALKSKGENPADYCIVGVDCTADGAEAVANGDMTMTVYQNPNGQGEGTFLAAYNMLNGNTINDGTEFELSKDNQYVMWVPFETVTKENVEQYRKN